MQACDRPYFTVELEHLLISQCEEVGTLELQHYSSDSVVDVKSRSGGPADQVVGRTPVQLHDGSLNAQLEDILLVGEGGLAAAGVDGRLLTVLVLHPLLKLWG